MLAMVSCLVIGFKEPRKKKKAPLHGYGLMMKRRFHGLPKTDDDPCQQTMGLTP